MGRAKRAGVRRGEDKASGYHCESFISSKIRPVFLREYLDAGGRFHLTDHAYLLAEAAGWRFTNPGFSTLNRGDGTAGLEYDFNRWLEFTGEEISLAMTIVEPFTAASSRQKSPPCPGPISTHHLTTINLSSAAFRQSKPECGNIPSVLAWTPGWACRFLTSDIRPGSETLRWQSLVGDHAPAFLSFVGQT